MHLVDDKDIVVSNSLILNSCFASHTNILRSLCHHQDLLTPLWNFNAGLIYPYSLLSKLRLLFLNGRNRNLLWLPLLLGYFLTLSQLQDLTPSFAPLILIMISFFLRILLSIEVMLLTQATFWLSLKGNERSLLYPSSILSVLFPYELGKERMLTSRS